MMLKILHIIFLWFYDSWSFPLNILSGRKTRTHHKIGVADPQAAPARRTLWDGDVLAVDCDGDWWSFAYRAAADVLFDVSLFYGHHGKRSRRWQPVGLIISAGVVTDVPRIAVQEGHGVEPWEAGASQTWEGQTTKLYLKKAKQVRGVYWVSYTNSIQSAFYAMKKLY